MALSAGRDPDELTMDDAYLMTRVMVRAGRAPGLNEFYGQPAAGAVSPTGFLEMREGRRTVTSWASSAEQFEAMVESGWARRGAA